MRWELNEWARRLDNQPGALELREDLVQAAASSDSVLKARFTHKCAVRLLAEQSPLPLGLAWWRLKHSFDRSSSLPVTAPLGQTRWGRNNW